MSAERPIKLHLGCGNKHWPGFKNHDSETDLRSLPYDDCSVDEIHLIHVFEHLPRAKIGFYLAEWRRVLKPGGLLVLEMPCLDKIARMILDGEENYQMTLFGLFGDATKGPLMEHKWCYTEKELKLVMEGAGFQVEFLGNNIKRI